MAKKKMSSELIEFFQKIGKKGGKNRAKKHSAEQLSQWAKKGGRPKKEQEAAPAA